MGMMSKMQATKYSMLVETLKNEILGGKYVLSKPFPSIRALIRRFNLSDTTVQRALDELFHQGLISRRQGRGTFVTTVATTRTIGLIVPDHGRSEFFPAIVKEISRLAQEKDYTLCFGEVSASTDAGRACQLENLVRDFIARRVFGVIFQPIDYIENGDAVNKRVLQWFDVAHIPVVLCDYDFVDAPERSKYDVVGINNVEAGVMMVEHLLSAGAKKIGFHLMPYAPKSHQNYIRGARYAALDRKCADRVLVADPGDEEALRRFLKRGRPDAFVCGNDSSAARLKKTLWKLGLGVPQDILLTGMNDLQIAPLLTPPLTTVHLPCERIAEVAFERLVLRISRPEIPPVEVNLPVRLVCRESTKMIPARKKKRK